MNRIRIYFVKRWVHLLSAELLLEYRKERLAEDKSQRAYDKWVSGGAKFFGSPSRAPGVHSPETSVFVANVVAVYKLIHTSTIKLLNSSRYKIINRLRER